MKTFSSSQPTSLWSSRGYRLASGAQAVSNWDWITSSRNSAITQNCLIFPVTYMDPSIRYDGTCRIFYILAETNWSQNQILRDKSRSEFGQSVRRRGPRAPRTRPQSSGCQCQRFGLDFSYHSMKLLLQHTKMCTRHSSCAQGRKGHRFRYHR